MKSAFQNYNFYLKSICLILISFFCQHVVAQAGATLGEPRSSGNGCPQGSVASVLSPDNRVLSLLFDQFSIDTVVPIENAGLPQYMGKYKTCNVSIPVQVPAGVQARIVSLDIRGFAQIPESTTGVVSARIALANMQGLNIATISDYIANYNFLRTISGPFEGDFYYSQPAYGTYSQNGGWSECGKNTAAVIEMTESMMMKGRDVPPNIQSLLSIDSADVTSTDSTFKINLQWQPCVAGAASAPPPPRRRHRR